jgi:hypothetical protein
MAPPEGSVTTPLIVAVLIWADTRAAKRRVRNAAAIACFTEEIATWQDTVEPSIGRPVNVKLVFYITRE